MVGESLAWIWMAFDSLSRARGHSDGGPLPIRHSEMLAWCELHSIPPDQREDLVTLLQRLDATYLVRRAAAIREEIEKEREETRERVRKAQTKR